MAKQRGMILVFSLIVILVLSVLLEVLYLKVINENRLANRYVNSLRAFWLAEAGIATVKANSGLGAASGSLGGENYTFNVPQPQPVPNTGNLYWIISSTGNVNLPGNINVSRTLNSTVKTNSDSSKFPYAIDTTTDLVIKGAVSIVGTSKEYDNAINFNNMFGVSKTNMKVAANHLYTDSNFGAPLNHITWVDVVSGHTMDIASNLTGSGILIINGDVKISGSFSFNGIIYVIGTLTMTGTVTTNGSIVAESSATADTKLAGTVNINFNLSQIQNSLTDVQFLNKQIVAWQEV